MPLTWKRVIDSQAEKLKELDKEIRPFRQNWEEADSMKSSVESLQNRVTELESVDKSSGQAARNTGEGGRTGAGLGLGGTWTQVSAVARTRGVHSASEQGLPVMGEVCARPTAFRPRCLWQGQTVPLGLVQGQHQGMAAVGQGLLIGCV